MSAGLPVMNLPPPSDGLSGSNGNAHIHKMPSSSTMGMEDDEDMTFDSPQEESAHYREKYRRIMDMLDETRAELDEFQASSKELEDELERELAATDKVQAELKERITKLEAEKEEWKVKYVNLQKLHSSTTGAMQREMDNLRSERDKTLVALRDLEMGNDELERNERVAVSSLLDLESKYNRAIEEKTLLEQEVIQKQDLDVECQRLKDDLRDANSEISILKDQLTRTTVPTPPSSISQPMSPVQEASLELSQVDIPPFTSPAVNDLKRTDQLARTPDSNTPSRQSSLTRSNTISSIPTLSPAVKRYSVRLADSPSGLSHLARSTTLRNLAYTAGPTPPAPGQLRNSSGLPQPSPAKPVNLNQAAKTKGFKLLHDLQARLKATDDKLGSKVPKRNVSGPLPLGISRRIVSNAAKGDADSTDAKNINFAKQSTTPSELGDKSGATFLSPNGWVLVTDSEGEDTPLNANTGMRNMEPASPLETNFRSTSSASNKPLPSRPGIPSPLASSLSRSTSRSTTSKFPRPTSRTATTNGNLSASSTRPPSRQTEASGGSSRPISPTMLPQPTRSYLRSPTPTFGQALSASTSVSANSSRPSSRSAHRTLGRGPPPSSREFPNAQPLLLSVSGAAPTTPSSSSGMRRSTRRSSLGVAEAGLPASSIPAPTSSTNRTPGRPVSVPVFGNGTPPPVPRIPSAHLRASSRDKMLGHGQQQRNRDRDKRTSEIH